MHTATDEYRCTSFDGVGGFLLQVRAPVASCQPSGTVSGIFTPSVRLIARQQLSGSVGGRAVLVVSTGRLGKGREFAQCCSLISDQYVRLVLHRHGDRFVPGRLHRRSGHDAGAGQAGDERVPQRVEIGHTVRTVPIGDPGGLEVPSHHAGRPVGEGGPAGADGKMTAVIRSDDKSILKHHQAANPEIPVNQSWICGILSIFSIFFFGRPSRRGLFHHRICK